jgi:ATP-dependent Clp protease ATP-binding subunit ClpC
MFERFTDAARAVTVKSQEEARLLGHNYIGTEHFALGLMGVDSEAQRVLANHIDRDEFRALLVEWVGENPTAPSGHIPFTPRSKKVLELSLREALQLGSPEINPTHQALGLIREGGGIAVAIMGKLSDPAAIRQELLKVVGDESERTLPDLTETLDTLRLRLGMITTSVNRLNDAMEDFIRAWESQEEE